MNTFTKSMAVIVLSCGSIGLANAESVLVATDSSPTTKLCIQAANGNVLRMATTMKDANMSKRYVAEKVTCNELSLVDFVEQYGNNVERVNNFITNGEYSANQQTIKVASSR